MRYLELAEELRTCVAHGAYGPTGVLPSEAEIGRQHNVSRVTVRRALELLRDEGVVTSRQGAGWFVASDPVRQAVGRFRTVEAALEASGSVARRKVLAFGFEPASPSVAVALQLAPGDDVLKVRRLTYADDEPFGLVTTWVPAEFGRNLSRAAVEQSTLYDLLPIHGVEPVRGTQSITAVAADAGDARALQVKAGTPLLAYRRVTYAKSGRAVVLSEHRYPGHRTSFDVEFGLADPAYPSRRHLRSVGEHHG